MKVVILCGGKGTRLAPDFKETPKPLVPIGGRPILIHLMNYFSSEGLNNFILALGHRKEKIISMIKPSENIKMVDTGKESMTGGRLLRLKDYLKETFILTYSDGLSDIDINSLLDFHKSHGKIATVTAVKSPSRFGELTVNGGRVNEISENERWINGGFFVFEPQIFDYLANDLTILEDGPLKALIREGNLMAYKHNGFWECMDTPSDVAHLNYLFEMGRIPENVSQCLSREKSPSHWAYRV